MKRKGTLINNRYSIIFIFLLCLCQLSAQTRTLKFNKDGKFKVVQFTDIHYKINNPDSQGGIDNMNDILDAEKPDLVVFTGDIIYSSPALSTLEKALEPVIKHKVPFAIAWGNHDKGQGTPQAQLQKYIESLPNNMGRTEANIPGDSNFALAIQSATGNKSAAIIYCFDSHSNSSLPQLKEYDWIYPEQINWYINKSKSFTKANNGKPLPSLAFFHIPLPEFQNALVEPEHRYVGYKWEDVSCPLINTGLYAAMLIQKDITGVFVGHDHDSDFITDYHGIKLAYGRCSGGKSAYNDLPDGNGARIIVLEEGSRDFTTWIRLHNNQIVQYIESKSLNN